MADYEYDSEEIVVAPRKATIAERRAAKRRALSAAMQENDDEALSSAMEESEDKTLSATMEEGEDEDGVTGLTYTDQARAAPPPLRRQTGGKYLPGTDTPVGKQWWIDHRGVGWWSMRAPPGCRPAGPAAKLLFQRRRAGELGETERKDSLLPGPNDADGVAVAASVGDPDATDDDGAAESAVVIAERAPQRRIAERERQDARAVRRAERREREWRRDAVLLARRTGLHGEHHVEYFMSMFRQRDMNDTLESWGPPGADKKKLKKMGADHYMWF